MSFLIPLLILLLLSVGISLCFEKTLVESFSMSVFLTILCLYMGGMADNLILGQIILYGGIISLWVYLYKQGRINRKNLARHRQEWLNSLLGLLPILLLIFVCTMGRELSWYDEYTHWGIVVKDLRDNNALHCINAAKTNFKDYPPATALIEYFFSFFAPTVYSENIYRGLDVLLIACLLPAFRNVTAKSGTKSHMLLAWAMLLMLAYGSYPIMFVLLQVDAALALLLASLLLAWFSNEKKDGFTLAYLFLNAMVLVLTKGSGVLLVALALVVFLADCLIKEKAKCLFAMRALLAPLAGATVAWGSWRLCTAMHGIAATRSQGSGIAQGVFAFLHGQIQDYQKETVRNFASAFLYGSSDYPPNSITYYQWTILLLVLAILLSFFLSDHRQGKMLMFAMPALHLSYSALLLAGYLFSFSSEEATSLASLTRYMPSCYLAATLFIAQYLLLIINDQEKVSERTLHLRWCIPLIGIAVCLWGFSVARYVNVFWPASMLQNRTTQELVADYQPLRELAQNEKAKDTQVYLLGTSNDYAFSALICRYELAPLQCSVMDASALQEQSSRQEWENSDYLFVLPDTDAVPLPLGIQTEGTELKAGNLYRITVKAGTVILNQIGEG